MAYKPIKSARGMEVCICNKCGLLQSFPTKQYQSRPPGSMSANADRSSYRYTKDIVSGRYQKCFDRFIDFSRITKILDIGSNRGAFIQYINNNAPNKQITAVEPDKRIVSNYACLHNVLVKISRFENVALASNYFNFAYCVHTLEHASSAKKMLSKINRALHSQGTLFLVVPNLIFYKDIIEELFIDPHNYHFQFNVLTDFVLQNGFKIEYSSKPDENEIILLLKKTCKPPHRTYVPLVEPSQIQKNKEDIKKYAKNILENRKKIKKDAEQLNKLARQCKLVIWGAGRIFDALVRFGNLDKDRIYAIVDKYLYKYEKSLHGLPLACPETLKKENKKHVLIYVASRDYSREITIEAKRLGFRKVIAFSC